MEELVPSRLRDTSKTAVAQWARCVFSAAKKGDRDARSCSMKAAAALAEKRGLRRAPAHFGNAPQVALTGGLFENQPGLPRELSPRACGARVPRRRSRFFSPCPASSARRGWLAHGKASRRRKPMKKESHRDPARLAAFARAATEQRNPRSRGLDQRSIPALVDLFIREERYVEKALAAQRNPIARAATLVAKKLAAGGRLFYVGAGTSGRLGVVDASEMPPTFNAPPEQVQAIIAGGAAAVFRSQEGAEDARDTGAAELRARGLTQARRGLRHRGQRPDAVRARGARVRARSARARFCSPAIRSGRSACRSRSRSIFPPARKS